MRTTTATYLLTLLLTLYLAPAASPLSAQSETEPNDFLEAANPLPLATPTTGQVGCAQDQSDYFLAFPPDDGTIQLFVSYTNQSEDNGADATTVIYNHRGVILGSNVTVNVPTGETRHDTLTLHCRQRDTLYFRTVSSRCFSYEISYRHEAPTGPDDAANNDLIATAGPIAEGELRRGRIGYIGRAGRDATDYYVTVPPDDGTVQLYVAYTNESRDDGADATTVIYNYRGVTLGSNVTINVPAGETRFDTLTLHCRQRDTMYFRVITSQCFSYQLSYRHFGPAGPDDGADNDLLATATPITSGQERRGRIGYIGRAGRDAGDYYLLAMPDDGTVQMLVEYTNESRDPGADATSVIYNHRGVTLASGTTINVPAGETRRDTLTVHCRQRDTVYLRTLTSQCFSYRLTPLITAPAASPDVEPNNAIAEANSSRANVPFSGRIGYLGRQGRDAADYYRIVVTELSSLDLRLEGENTSGAATADLTVTLLDKNGRMVDGQTLRDRQVGSFVEIMTFECLPADTFYLRLLTSQCFGYRASYNLRSEQPTAAIEYSRFGMDFAFRPETRRNEIIFWDFGDLTTSDRKYPRKEFGIGVYDVTLEATNTLCNVSALATERITVTGIEDYTPRRAGQLNGVGLFHIRLFGGGLGAGTQVQLSGNGTVMTAIEVFSPGPAEATAKFMAGGLSSGSYDLRITLENGEEYNFPGGFEIYEDTPGQDVTVEAIGPPRIRTNRWTDFTLRATNNQGRLLNGLPVIVVVPPDVETNILDIVERKTGRYVIKGDEWDKLTIDRGFFDDVFFDGNFDPAADSIVIDYDEINLMLEDAMTMEIDTLFGEPLEGTGYLLYFPLTPQNSSEEMKFRIRSSRNQNVEITAFPFPYTARSVGVRGDNPPGISGSNVVVDFFEDCAWEDAREYALQASTVLQFAPNQALAFVGEHAGKFDIATQNLFQTYTDWQYGGNVVDSDFLQRQTVAMGMELLGGKLPFGRNIEGLRDQVRLNNQVIAGTLKQRNGIQKIITRGSNFINRGPFVKMAMQRKIAALDDAVAALGANNSRLRQLGAMNFLTGFGSSQLANITSGRLQDIIPDDDNPYFAKPKEPEEVKKTPVRSVTSFDPNEIYGNAGVGGERYLKRDVALDYTVLFENVDTAQAAAQIVRVELNLDPNKYDLGRTTLGSVFFGGNYYSIERDRCEYFRDIDLRPVQNLLVRVQGKIDTLTGDVEWQFTSLDPETLDLPQGVDDGFLPPNRNPPEGDGSVSFITYPLSGVRSGDTLATNALIFFDDNAPIRTNTWSNIIDEDDPFSLLEQTVTTLDDSTFVIRYLADDATSGVEHYYLHYREGDRPWSNLPAELSASGETRVRIQPGERYELYVTVQDSVGNREFKPRRAELTILNGLVGTTAAERPVVGVTVYPNPSRGEVLRVQLPEKVWQSINTARPLDAVLVDMQGKVVLRRQLRWNSDDGATLPVAGLAAGTYVLTLRDATGRSFVGKVAIL